MTIGGQRHNLPQVNVNSDGTIVSSLRICELDRFEARKAVVAKLEEISAPH